MGLHELAGTQGGIRVGYLGAHQHALVFAVNHAAHGGDSAGGGRFLHPHGCAGLYAFQFFQGHADLQPQGIELPDAIDGAGDVDALTRCGQLGQNHAVHGRAYLQDGGEAVPVLQLADGVLVHAGQLQGLATLFHFRACLGVTGPGFQKTAFGNDSFGFELFVALQFGTGQLQAGGGLQVQSLFFHQFGALDGGQDLPAVYGFALGNGQGGEQAFLGRADHHELCIGHPHLGRVGVAPCFGYGIHGGGGDAQRLLLRGIDLYQGGGGNIGRKQQGHSNQYLFHWGTTPSR